MDRTADLRSAINSAIEPWRQRSDGIPPFTQSELVVMALALHDEPLDRKELFVWIVKTFFYYRIQIMASVYYHFGSSKRQMSHERALPYGQGASPPSQLSRGPSFYDTVLDYHVPLRSDTEEFTAGTRFSIDPAEASVFLAPRLKPFERKGHFPLLDLPAEIRNTIYEMLLVFPPSGIRINSKCTDHKGIVYTRTRDWSVAFSSELRRGATSWLNPNLLTWKYQPMRWQIEVGKLSKTLALACVNRQIRREALDVFYSRNTFCFANASHLQMVLSRMPALDRDRIERIAFGYPCDVVPYFSMRQALSIMSTMKSLRWLHISIIEHEWMRQPWHGDPEIQDRLQFNKAVAIGEAVDVVFEGDYPDFVKAQIREPPVDDDSEHTSEDEDRRPGDLPETSRSEPKGLLSKRALTGLRFMSKRASTVLSGAR